MQKNIGTADRMIRVVAAMVICFLYITNTINGPEGGLLLLLAVGLAFTSLLGISLLYRLFGINTSGEIQED